MPSSNQPGSNTEPPFNLPSGWEARWDSDTKRHYYVQMARALPQWEVPTEPAPTAPSRESTPPQFRDPYRRSPALTAPNAGRSEQTAEERSELGNQVMNAILGGKKPQSQSGRGGMGGR